MRHNIKIYSLRGGLSMTGLQQPLTLTELSDFHFHQIFEHITSENNDILYFHHSRLDEERVEYKLTFDGKSNLFSLTLAFFDSDDILSLDAEGINLSLDAEGINASVKKIEDKFNWYKRIWDKETEQKQSIKKLHEDNAASRNDKKKAFRLLMGDSGC